MVEDILSPQYFPESYKGELPKPKRRILEQFKIFFDRSYDDTAKREAYISWEEILQPESRYNRAFRNHTGVDLGSVVAAPTEIGQEKLVRWFIEHLGNPQEFRSLFVVDKNLATIAEHERILAPFMHSSLKAGTTMVYVCGEPIVQGYNNPLFELLNADKSYRLYIRYVLGEKASIDELLNFFAFAEYDPSRGIGDIFLGPGDWLVEGNFSVKNSLMLRDIIIQMYNSINKKIKDSEVVFTPTNFRPAQLLEQPA